MSSAYVALAVAAALAVCFLLLFVFFVSVRQPIHLYPSFTKYIHFGFIFKFGDRGQTTVTVAEWHSQVAVVNDGLCDARKYNLMFPFSSHKKLLAKKKKIYANTF